VGFGKRGLGRTGSQRDLFPEEQGEALRTTRKIDELGMNENDGLEIH